MVDKLRRYRLSPLAQSDLEDIWDYTGETWSVDQAARYHDGLIEAVEDLAAARKTGREAGIRLGYCKFSIGRHVIFYREHADFIDVIRILHQKMDADARLS